MASEVRGSRATASGVRPIGSSAARRRASREPSTGPAAAAASSSIDATPRSPNSSRSMRMGSAGAARPPAVRSTVSSGIRLGPPPPASGSRRSVHASPRASSPASGRALAYRGQPTVVSSRPPSVIRSTMPAYPTLISRSPPSRSSPGRQKSSRRLSRASSMWLPGASCGLISEPGRCRQRIALVRPRT